MMNHPLISIKDVSKIYDSKESPLKVLDAINITIKRGEYLAIVGKSGSGKSTLLNILSGIDYPSTGSVTINGTEITRLGESKLAKWRGKNIGIVFQFFQLIPTLTIAENLNLAMEFVNVIPKKERKNRILELLSQVGIVDHSDKLPLTLSGGEQQRAAIARALANDPNIIIADEPTGNLDSVTTESVYELLHSLAKKGKTVIVVTHEPDAATRFNRTLTMVDGKI